MKARISAVVGAVKRVVLSSELRPAEIQIVKAVAVAALGALGLDVSHVLHF